MLVDRDNRTAVASWRGALDAAAPRRPATVVVAAEQPDDACYHVRRPFMATRLLGVLDKIVIGGAPVAPPATTAPVETTARFPQGPSGSPPAMGANDDRYRALVVDDSMAVRKQMGLVLARMNVNVDFADAGEKALTLVEERPYDIVFLDVVMPGMDGYDVCKAIKRDRTKKHIPIVMLTGRSSPFDKVKGKLSGCDTYLTKPVSRDEFVGTLKKYLREPISSE
jgi:twitching motility two-component system response regulator PilG